MRLRNIDYLPGTLLLIFRSKFLIGYQNKALYKLLGWRNDSDTIVDTVITAQSRIELSYVITTGTRK
jgi:hypothetical protein